MVSIIGIQYDGRKRRKIARHHHTPIVDYSASSSEDDVSHESASEASMSECCSHLDEAVDDSLFLQGELTIEEEDDVDDEEDQMEAEEEDLDDPDWENIPPAPSAPDSTVTRYSGFIFLIFL